MKLLQLSLRVPAAGKVPPVKAFAPVALATTSLPLPAAGMTTDASSIVNRGRGISVSDQQQQQQ